MRVMADDFKKLVPVVKACPIHGAGCGILGPVKDSKAQRRRVARHRLKEKIDEESQPEALDDK